MAASGRFPDPEGAGESEEDSRPSGRARRPRPAGRGATPAGGSRIANQLVGVGVRLLAAWLACLAVGLAVVRPVLAGRDDPHRPTDPPAWFETAMVGTHLVGAAGLTLVVVGVAGKARRRWSARPLPGSGGRSGADRSALRGADDELPLAEEVVEPHAVPGAGRAGSKRHAIPKAGWRRAESVYVPVSYPVWLGIASFAWAVVGWLIAAFAPRLAFVPGSGALHYLFPTITVGFLGANLFFAARSLLRGAHALRLAVVTGVEVALFTTLFFQLYAHVGAELYDAPGATAPWQWVQFSLAHALRAGDVFDAVEAYGWGIQSVKHSSPVVAVFVVAYHVVVDVFFLGLVWAAVGRVRERALADAKFRGLMTGVGLAGLAAWLIAWVVVAFFVRPWRAADVPLWFVENVLRVIDFADVMESFGIRLHTLPREGLVGALAVLCRLWVALGLTVLLTRKRKPPARRVLTPPGASAGRYWWLRVGALAGMAVAFLVTGLFAWLVAGRPAESLAAAVREGPEGRAEVALRALRRMGPSAGDAVPQLVAARAAAPPATRDGITRTLGYLGPPAVEALQTFALTEPPESAGLAVDALAAAGGRATPELVAVWERTRDGAVRARAEAALVRLGSDAAGPLLEGMTPANAHGHYVWLERLDPNWRLRDMPNPTARACQDLPGMVRRAREGGREEAIAALLELQTCGTAAREALDVAFERMDSVDPRVSGAAVTVAYAAGPGATPQILRVAVGGTGRTSLSALVALNKPEMWTEAVYDHPDTLPTLIALARRPGALYLTLEHLARYGPAAAPAAPAFFLRAADTAAEIRGKVHATLDRIHPGWRSDPALTDALPGLLFQLPNLPPAEAREFYAAFRDVPPGRAADLAAEVRKQLGEVNRYFLPPERWTGEYPQIYAQTIDRVFSPVERLGPKARVLVPALETLYRENEQAANDPRAAIVNARLRQTIPAIGGTGPGDMPGGR